MVVHTLESSCTIWSMWGWCIFKGDNEHILGQSKPVLTLRFSQTYKCDKCQTLHDGTSLWALPVHTIFREQDHISKSWQCQTVLTADLLFLSD